MPQYTKEELLAELARRGELPSTEQAPTPTGPTPARATPPPSQEQPADVELTLGEQWRQVGRDTVGDLLDMGIAGAKSVGDVFTGEAESMSDTYSTHKANLDAEEVRVLEAMSPSQRQASRSLGLISIGVGGAGAARALPMAARAALAKGASRVLGKGAKAAGGAAANPYTIGAKGAATATRQTAKKGGVLRRAVQGAELGAVTAAPIDLYELGAEGDLMPDKMLGGATAGAAMGAGSKRLADTILKAFGKTIGEAGASQLSRRLIAEKIRPKFGDKAAMYVYNGLAPSSRAHIARTLDEFKKFMSKGAK